MTLDPAFAALELDSLEDAALERLQAAGASYGSVRVHQTRHRYITARDDDVEEAADGDQLGVGVRVVKDGCWGFAASPGADAASAVRAAERALHMAEVSRTVPGPPVELAPQAPAVGVHVGDYEINPFDVPLAEAAEWVRANCADLAAETGHAAGSLQAVLETTSLADLAGSRIRQQRARIGPSFTAILVTDEGFEDMRTTAPPTGRGWEYATGAGWDWDSELASLPALLREKAVSPSIEPGRYDLLLDPTNLWLTIHESVGHATELDRALGYEANYAGTTFATPDRLGSLRYGSGLMTVRGDRVQPHGLATIGWDDEGVPAGQWDLVRDGVLVGYQLDRQMAGPDGVSNGCAYADAYDHVPVQRMPNVSLQPDPHGPDTGDLLAALDDGIYIVGDKSWSIDMQRFNFQFTGQRFYRVRSGRIVGQLRDVAYQSDTLTFWNSLSALGGPASYRLGGALNCGKGQPGQVAPVSHGCPGAVFSGINVLNTRTEAGR